jgi:hypothetical protein
MIDLTRNQGKLWELKIVGTHWGPRTKQSAREESNLKQACL